MRIFRNKKGKGYYIAQTVFLAMFIFSIYKIYHDDSVDVVLKQTLLEQASEHPFAVGFFIKSLDELTPQIGGKLPILDKEIFLISKFPVYSWFHLAFTIFLIALSGFFMRKSNTKKWHMFLIFLLMLLIGYYVGSILLYIIYISASNIIGFTFAEANLFMAKYSQNFDNILVPLIAVSLFAMISIFKVIFKNMKK